MSERKSTPLQTVWLTIIALMVLIAFSALLLLAAKKKQDTAAAGVVGAVACQAIMISSGQVAIVVGDGP